MNAPEIARVAPAADVPRAPRIAVLVPCRNEAQTVAKVVGDFLRELPDAEVWVCDNRSTDDTSARARAAGARVLREERAGKGYSVRRLLNAVDADAYVMVDGDDTYDAASVHTLLEPVLAGELDMVVGARVTPEAELGAAYRKGHQSGNRVFAAAMSKLFDYPLDDVFSGYRVLSRRFVRSFPSLARGFEIETELTVHALDLGMPVREIPAPYGARPKGSVSKLNTWRDGARITGALVHLYAQVRPARFYGAASILLAGASLALGLPVVLDYLETREVPRLPTAVLASAMMLLAAMSAMCGVILDSVGRSRKEVKRLAYLAAGMPLAWQPAGAPPARAGAGQAASRRTGGLDASRGAAGSAASRSSSTTGA